MKIRKASQLAARVANQWYPAARNLYFVADGAGTSVSATCPGVGIEIRTDAPPPPRRLSAKTKDVLSLLKTGADPDWSAPVFSSAPKPVIAFEGLRPAKPDCAAPYRPLALAIEAAGKFLPGDEGDGVSWYSFLNFAPSGSELHVSATDKVCMARHALPWTYGCNQGGVLERDALPIMAALASAFPDAEAFIQHDTLNVTAHDMLAVFTLADIRYPDLRAALKGRGRTARVRTCELATVIAAADGACVSFDVQSGQVTVTDPNARRYNGTLLGKAFGFVADMCNVIDVTVRDGSIEFGGPSSFAAVCALRK